MRQQSPGILTGLAIAVAIAAYMNAATIRELWHDGTVRTTLLLSMSSEDGKYYLSRIREVADGHPLMGSSALREHRDGISPNGFIEVLTGGITWVTGFSLEATVTVTAVLFPVLILFLTYLWVGAILRVPLLTIATVLVIWGSVLGTFGLLRESSPKVTLLFPSLYLCILFLPTVPRPWHRIVRGVLLGIMLYTYHYHWTLLLCFEGLTSLYALLTRRDRWAVVRETYWVAAPFAIFSIPYAIQILSILGDPTARETWQRFGMIPTHAPAAPALQLVTAAWLLILTSLQAIGDLRDRRGLTLIFLLAAGLLAVNSNLITGLEAEFEGHYGRIVRLFTWTAAFLALSTVARPRAARAIAAAVAALVVAVALHEFLVVSRNADATLRTWEANPTAGIIAWIDEAVPPESVILAPYTLTSVLPVLTDTYVFMNYSARSFFMRTEELLDRYLTHVAFFPEDREDLSTGVQSVFGNYPGSLYSRTRTAHNIRTLFRVPFTKTIPDFIPDQHLRARLERELSHPPRDAIRSTLARYALDYVATPHPLPKGTEDLFEEVDRYEGFTLYRTMPRAVLPTS